jgi:hypothetical protein
MQLPLGETMDSEDMLTLRHFLQFVAEHRREIAERLHQTRTSL